jgi:Spy/CpxP family protein refolding chaperone
MMGNAVRPLLMAGVFSMGIVLGSVPATAQGVPPRQEADPFAAVLYPPELIMQHARAVRLSDDQRSAITELIQQVQQRVLGLQWQLAEQVQALKQTLAGARIDQDRAIDQLNRVLETEKTIKQAHLEMLVRIKNLLRPEQQAELARLRGAAGAERNDFEPQGES